MVEYDDKVEMPMNRERVQAKISLRELAFRASLVLRVGLCKGRPRGRACEKKGSGHGREEAFGIFYCT
jgi:hypothetical protein